MRFSLILIYTLFFIQSFAEDIDEITENFKSKATIILLNKVTANSTKISLTLDQFIKYDDLEIKLIKCWQNPLEEFKEAKMLLKVKERTFNNEDKIIYYNWMFTQHPGINSLEHPVYDIIPITCE